MEAADWNVHLATLQRIDCPFQFYELRVMRPNDSFIILTATVPLRRWNQTAVEARQSLFAEQEEGKTPCSNPPVLWQHIVRGFIG